MIIIEAHQDGTSRYSRPFTEQDVQSLLDELPVCEDCPERAEIATGWASGKARCDACAPAEGFDRNEYAALVAWLQEVSR